MLKELVLYDVITNKVLVLVYTASTWMNEIIYCYNVKLYIKHNYQNEKIFLKIYLKFRSKKWHKKLRGGWEKANPGRISAHDGIEIVRWRTFWVRFLVDICLQVKDGYFNEIINVFILNFLAYCCFIQYNKSSISQYPVLGLTTTFEVILWKRKEEFFLKHIIADNLKCV